MIRGNLVEAYSLTEETVSLARKSGDTFMIASTMHDLAFVCLDLGEYARACATYEECLAVFRELGDKVGIAASLYQLALGLFLSLGDQERVTSLLEKSLELWKEIRFSGWECSLVLPCGTSSSSAGRCCPGTRAPRRECDILQGNGRSMALCPVALRFSEG